MTSYLFLCQEIYLYSCKVLRYPPDSKLCQALQVLSIEMDAMASHISSPSGGSSTYATRPSMPVAPSYSRYHIPKSPFVSNGDLDEFTRATTVCHNSWPKEEAKNHRCHSFLLEDSVSRAGFKRTSWHNLHHLWAS